MATAWRGAGFDFPKRMQFRRTRLTEQPVPGVGANPHDAGEVSLNVAEAHGAQQRREVATKRPDGGAAGGARIDRRDQKDRGPGQSRNHRLRFRGQFGLRGHWL